MKNLGSKKPPIAVVSIQADTERMSGYLLRRYF